MTETSIKVYKKVDKYAKGEDDINDLNTSKERKVLTNFLSPDAFFKIFNSHEPAVDNDIQMPTGDAMYGRQLLNATSHTITLPSVKQVKRSFGIEDLSALRHVMDESDDENDSRRALKWLVPSVKFQPMEQRAALAGLFHVQHYQWLQWVLTLEGENGVSLRR